MKPIHTKGRTIGLLGGSFNPAHAGHLHISDYALKTLGLDAVWWLVTPQNPLKHVDDLAEYGLRLAKAGQVAKNPRIHVSDIEAQMNTRYSYETIAQLKKRFPGTHFIWLMGADNLAGFHRWRHWRRIINQLPLVVFDRMPYSYPALASRTASVLARFASKDKNLKMVKAAPALHYAHLPRHPLSATYLRKTLGKGAFLGHNEGVRT